MKALLALALLLAAAPLRAQDADDDGGNGTLQPTISATGIPDRPLREGTGGSAKGGTRVNTIGAAKTDGDSGSSGGPGGTASGQPPLKITNLHTYPNIMSLPEHQYAHGILRVRSSGEAWAIGMTAYSEEVLKTVPGGNAQSGSCVVSMSPRAFSDQGCELHVWISQKPGGAPLSKNCVWAQSAIINDATNVGGHWYTAKGGKPVKDWSSLCNMPKNGGRYYCNYSAGGFDSRFAPKKCDAILNFPMGLMPQDVYPDSFPK